MPSACTCGAVERPYAPKETQVVAVEQALAVSFAVQVSGWEARPVLALMMLPARPPHIEAAGNLLVGGSPSRWIPTVENAVRSQTNQTEKTAGLLPPLFCFVLRPELDNVDWRLSWQQEGQGHTQLWGHVAQYCINEHLLLC